MASQTVPSHPRLTPGGRAEQSPAWEGEEASSCAPKAQSCGWTPRQRTWAPGLLVRHVQGSRSFSP